MQRLTQPATCRTVYTVQGIHHMVCWYVQEARQELELRLQVLGCQKGKNRSMSTSHHTYSYQKKYNITRIVIRFVCFQSPNVSEQQAVLCVHDAHSSFCTVAGILFILADMTDRQCAQPWYFLNGSSPGITMIWRGFVRMAIGIFSSAAFNTGFWHQRLRTESPWCQTLLWLEIYLCWVLNFDWSKGNVFVCVCWLWFGKASFETHACTRLQER